MINFKHLILIYLVVCLVATLLLGYLSNWQVTEIFSQAISTLDFFSKTLGVLIVIVGIVLIIQNYLEKRHKKIYWQELSDDAQLFLNTFAGAHPDIQRAIFRILEIRRPNESQATGDENFGEFLQAYRQNRTRLREAASRVMTDDDKSNP